MAEAPATRARRGCGPHPNAAITNNTLLCRAPAPQHRHIRHALVSPIAMESTNNISSRCTTETNCTMPPSNSLRPPTKSTTDTTIALHTAGVSDPPLQHAHTRRRLALSSVLRLQPTKNPGVVCWVNTLVIPKANERESAYTSSKARSMQGTTLMNTYFTGPGFSDTLFSRSSRKPRGGRCARDEVCKFAV